MNEGERKAFTVCDACWTRKVNPQRAEARRDPPASPVEPVDVAYWFQQIELALYRKIGNTFEVNQAARLEQVILRLANLRVAAPPAGPLENFQAWLRAALWMNHGCSPAVLYGDDSEMQCNHLQRHGNLDFKRQPIEQLTYVVLHLTAPPPVGALLESDLKALIATWRDYAGDQDTFVEAGVHYCIKQLEDLLRGSHPQEKTDA